MAPIRVCHELGCRTLLSMYNPTRECWEHRKPPRRIASDLAGKRIQRDDQWLLMQRLEDDATVETWRPHMMTDTFVDGLRSEMTATDRAAYEDGSWLG